MKISSKFKSIQSSIFCAVSILVLSAVLVVTVVSLRYTNSSIYENSVMYTQTIIKQLNQNIDSYISYMDNIASVIAQSGDAYKYLYSEKGYGATKDENYSEYRQRLVEQFKTILKGRADIRNIGIVREDKNSPSLFDNGLSVRNTYVDLNTQPWYADAVGKYDRYNLTSSHVQNVIKGERPWVITLSRGIRNYTGTEAEDGVVFLDLNYSAISELCAQSSMGDKGYVFILDQNGNIVYHPQQQQLYNELQTENISLVMNAKSDIVTVGKGDDEKIYALSHSDITGWTIVGCMNMSELLRNSRQTRSIYVLVAVGLIIVALLISSLIARNITLPIQKLRDSMKSVQKGNFDIEDIEVISDNEIGSLTRSFNVMTHRIRELMEQNVKEQEQKRKIELKALQSQINPHFLYNTLSLINWKALAAGEEEIDLTPTGEEGILLIKALCGLGRVVSNVNIPNTAGQIPNLPENALVETNALFDRDSIHPVAAGKVPENVKALLMPHIENHERTLKAALTCDEELVVQAFLHDPVVKGKQPQEAQVRSLVHDMIENTRKYLPDGWN